jgi:hypothetical protein
LLASTSLGCLLADFYGICSMRFFTVAIFLPATFVLAALAVDDSRQGDGRLCRSILMGLGGGLLAAVAYDTFRLPFVYARQWGIAGLVPPMNLFKVFPGFGAMILGQPVDQPAYSTAASLLGWSYHFSNGASIGILYLALVGDPLRRHWSWAIALAVALELGMILTPYPRVFQIPVTARFVAVTLAAHAIFGVGLGLTVRWFAGLGSLPAEA